MYSSGLSFAFAFLYQYVRGYPGRSAWTVHEYCCIQLIINAKYIYKVAESEAGEMKAKIGEKEHVHDHWNAKILASCMDQKKGPL